MGKILIKFFLRFAISTAFLSAVADRFGWWSEKVSVWGNWDSFLSYSQQLNPWFPESLIAPIGIIVTVAEIIFGLFLLIGFRTELVRNCLPG